MKEFKWRARRDSNPKGKHPIRNALSPRAVRGKQAITIAVCAAIVLSAYLILYRATASFNPSPQSVTLDTSASCSPAAPPCPAFMIESANLTARNTADYTSQWLTLKVTALGPSEVSEFSVYFSGSPLGNVTEELLPGQTKTFGGWGIPTTIGVVPGRSYAVVVEAEILGPGGQVSAEFWSAVQVVAR
jgi:hypothetical protein